MSYLQLQSYASRNSAAPNPLNKNLEEKYSTIHAWQFTKVAESDQLYMYTDMQYKFYTV